MDRCLASLITSDCLAAKRETYFDTAIGGWVATGYFEVTQILGDARFVTATLGAPEMTDVAAADIAVDYTRAQMKRDAGEILLRLDRAMPALLTRMTVNLEEEGECDFLTDVLKPWCLAAAASSIGGCEDARCGALADNIFTASAFPDDLDLQQNAISAVSELNERLDTENLIAVQTFVALAASVPVFLGTASALLLSDPDQWRTLQQDPTLVSVAIEECLRLSGLPTIQFRRAACDFDLNQTKVRKNQKVLLMIQLANRDPLVFSNPNSFQMTRANNAHLSFGRGAHACVGAHIVRSVGRTMITHLTSIIQAAELREVPCWKGVAMRYLENLPVRLAMRQ